VSLISAWIFWDLIDVYNPDIVIGTESWLREAISNAEVLRDDHKAFRRDRNTRSGVYCLYCIVVVMLPPGNGPFAV
jgi:hypothetical protein